MDLGRLRAMWTSLSRRIRTLLVAGVLFLVLFVLALTLPVPYVILSPGPTCNTLTTCYDQQVIKIDGIATRKPSGHLNLTTVSVSTRSISAFQALAGWLLGDEVVVPRSSVYPPGTSEKQTNQQNAADFQQSQDSATAAAACELGYPQGFGVIDVVKDGPSAKILKAGDEFVSVAGTPIAERKDLDGVLTTKAPGTKVNIVIKRGGRQLTEVVTLGPFPKGTKPGRKGGFLGVVPDKTCLAPFTVDLGLGNEIGGPSAGMMFALGIIDLVGKTDLTKGRFVAGTGTIDPAGKVGAIGGIQLKMIAAKRKGATLFLAPRGNCEDVKGAIPAGLTVASVGTLHEAVQVLIDTGDGKRVKGC